MQATPSAREYRQECRQGGLRGAFWHSNPHDGILIRFLGHPCMRLLASRDLRSTSWLPCAMSARRVPGSAKLCRTPIVVPIVGGIRTSRPSARWTVPAATSGASTSAPRASRPARSLAANSLSSRRHGSRQSIGSAPISCSNSLVRLNGRDPKNPRLADSGDGCADSILAVPSSHGLRVAASRPHRIATNG